MTREIKAPEAKMLISESFDKQHLIEFNEETHRYKLDGKQAVSVTTMEKAGYPTSQGLISWYQTTSLESLFTSMTKLDEQGWNPRDAFWPIHPDTKAELFKVAKNANKGIAQEAADIGTICHGYAELHSVGKTEEAEALLNKVRRASTWSLIESCVNKYKDWASKDQGKLVCAEALVASLRYKYCGKFDRLDNVNGKMILRDYKTSKAIFLDQFIQLGAYAVAIKEWMNLDVGGMEVLRFGKDDGEFQNLLIDDPREIKLFMDQAIRCRQTHEFRKLENDPRWAWKGKKAA